MSEKQPSLKQNYIYNLLYQVLTLATPFITAPYIARVLGADGVGLYSYTNSYMAYFTMFAALGTASYGTREIARSRNDKVEYSRKFWEIEILTIITTSICILIWGVLIVLSKTYRIYFIVLIPTLLATMFDISWFFRGHERVSCIVGLNSLCKVIGVISIFLLVKSKNDLWIYILINSLVLMLGNLSMWIFLRGMLVRINVHKLSLFRHLRETLIYFVPTIAVSIYTVLDKTLIGIITKDNFQNGYYEQASKIVMMLKSLVFTSVNSIMGARISYLFMQNNIEEIKRRIQKSMSFILLISFGVVFGIVGVAENFVPIFLGEGYKPVIILLYFMSPLVIIIGVSNCLGTQYYTPAGLRAKSAKYIIMGSALNFCMNLVLIPFWGMNGAVLGSIFAELLVLLLYIKNCDGYMNINIIWKNCYKRIVAGVIMLCIVYLIGKYKTGMLVLLIQIVVGIVIYFATLFALRDILLLEMWEQLLRKVGKHG